MFLLSYVFRLFLAIVIIFTGLFLINYLSFTSCVKRASTMNFNYKYDSFSGCFIEYKPKKWVSIYLFRAF